MRATHIITTCLTEGVEDNDNETVFIRSPIFFGL
jgi:hypothetical protein